MLLAKWLLTVQGTTSSPAVVSTNMYSYGDNLYGQAGQNSLVYGTYPRPKPVGYGLLSWGKIVAGDGFAIGLRSDNKLFGWGKNNIGQLGIEDQLNRSSPSQIGTGDWSNVYTKGSTVYGLSSDNLLYAWGYSEFGQLGNDKILYTDYVKSWSKVAVGFSHTVAIRSDGALFTWGLNNFGQLGTNDTIARSSGIQLGTDTWVDVAAGRSQSYAIRSDGKLFSWGMNPNGELGDTTLIHRSSPVQVGVTDSDLATKLFVSVRAMNRFASVVDSDGIAYTFGVDSNGETGLGSPSRNVVRPITYSSLVDEASIQAYASSASIEPYPYSWTQVAFASNTTYAIRNDGTLWSWGYNDYGQLGTNDTIQYRPYPIQVGNESWKLLGNVGGNSTSFMVAVRADGTVWSWGRNQGNLGTGDVINRSSPTQIGSQDFASISLGASHVVALNNQGLLYTWGVNDTGQLGQNDGIAKSSPVQVGASSWLFATAGERFSAAIDINGLVYTWGVNTNGQLGNATDINNKSSPVQISTTSINNYEDLISYATYKGLAPLVFQSWTQVAIGNPGFILGIRGDTGYLYSWGENSSGQLGIGNTISRSSPVQIGTSQWIAVATAASTSYAIRQDGALFAWGNNTLGRLGDVSTINKSSPVQIGTSSWLQVHAANGSHVAALRSDGRLFTWGANDGGQLGLNSTPNSHLSSPTQVGTSSWTAISASNYGTMAIRQDRALFAWGVADSGQLGIGINVRRSSPVQVTSIIDGQREYSYRQITSNPYPFSYTQIDSIASNFSTFYAIDSAKRLFTWGSNANGLTGINLTAGSVSSPSIVGTSSWSSVASTFSHTLAIRNDGSLFAWGTNNFGQLGNSAIISRSSPVQIGTSSWSMVAAGEIISYAIRRDGALFAWGYNSLGSLGINSTVHRSSPSAVGTSSWIKVTANGTTAAAINVANKLFVWGNNGYGQAGGDNTVITKSSPVQVTSLLVGDEDYQYRVGQGLPIYSWNVLSSSNLSYYMIREDGALFAFGTNATGQLGTNNTLPVTFPVQIGTSSWLSVSAGGTHVSAIRADGALFTWGKNDFGQLGIGSTVINRSSPVQIGTSSWIAVSSGYNTTVAIRSGGGLFAWGANDAGKLGLNDLVNRSSPVQIGSDTWSKLTDQHYVAVAAIKSDNTLWMWGENATGLVGSSDTSNKSSPVQVTSMWYTNAEDEYLTNKGLPYAEWKYADIGNGASHTFAITTDGALWGWNTNPAGTIGNINSTGVLGLNDTFTRRFPTKIGTSSWTMVSSHGNGGAAIRIDGALFVWGQNNVGQLGLGDSINRSSPVQLGTSSWLSVSSGLSHIVAVRSDGLLFAWGVNTNGMLGDNTTVTKSSPVQIGTSSWTFISAGLTRTHAIRLDGTLYSFGLNTNGELGTNNLTQYNSPVAIGTSSWTSVNAGFTHTTGITTNGSLFAWGGNTTGALGIGNIISRSSPVQIGNGVWKYSAGSNAILNDDTLWGWGPTINGNPLNVDLSSPVQIGTFSTWKFIGNQAWHKNSAIAGNNRLYQWGTNVLNYQPTTGIVSATVITTAYSDTWNGVSVASSHTMGLRSDGRIFTWGYNFDGQLGNFSRTTSTTYGSNGLSMPIMIGNSSWTSVAASAFGPGLPGYTSAAIRGDGLLFTWGVGTSGETGLSELINRSSPTQVGALSWRNISSDVRFMSDINHRLYTWGTVSSVPSGDVYGIGKSSPTQIVTSSFGTDSFSDVVLGGEHILALRNDGRLFSAGRNHQGQLGRSNVVNSSVLLAVGTSSWTQVFASVGPYLAEWSGAIRQDGALFMWGNNSYGQLGLNNTLSRSSPVQIGTESWVFVRGNVGVRNDIRNGLFIWGQNTNVPLGDNLYFLVSRSSPVQVMNGFYGDSWIMASSGRDHSVGVRSDNKLFTWGYNNNGELGDSSGISKSAPIQIGISNWKYVSANGEPNTFGITTDGYLWSWGLNNSGQLGAITSPGINRSSPVQVGSGSYWDKVGIGNSTAYGLSVDNVLMNWGATTGSKILPDNGDASFVTPVTTGLISTFNMSWTQIRAGSNHTVGIRDDGAILTTGLNNQGQLGTGYYTGATVNNYFRKINNNSSWSNISAGGDHNLALSMDSKLFTWGYNNANQLGTGLVGTANNTSNPAQVTTESVIAIAAGASTSAMIRNSVANGQLYIWGQGGWGNNGNSKMNNNASPTIVPTIKQSYIMLAAGYSHSVGLLVNNNLVVSGRNANGELGIGDSINRSNPVQLGLTQSFIAVDAGLNHSAGIDSNNTLWVWGAGVSGKTGVGTTASKSSPVQVTTKFDNYTEMLSYATAVGQSIDYWTYMTPSYSGTPAFGIRNDGKLFVWGEGFNWVSGLGSQTLYLSLPVMLGNESWTTVTVGNSRALAIRSDGLLFAWGDNRNGQLGMNDTVYRSSPTQVGTSSWTSVVAGLQHVLAIKSDGTLHTWGYNFNGQLGVLTNADRSSPTQLGTDLWTKLGITDSTSFAIRNDGALFTWGDYQTGIYGIPTVTSNRSSPVQIGTSSWTAVTGGSRFAAAIRSDNTLWAWGINTNGQLGLGDTFNRSSPTQIGSSWISISAGDNFLSAVDSSKLMYAWGQNASGQLALGDSINRSSPVQIGTSSWSLVSSRKSTLMALTVDNIIFGAGSNASGGDLAGNLIDFYSASTTVSNLVLLAPPVVQWSHISLGTFGSAAIRKDGTLFTWGSNTNGSLGDMTPVAYRPVPTKLNGIWKSVSINGTDNDATSSYVHVMAIKEDNTLYGWGNNNLGELGLLYGHPTIPGINWLSVSRSSPTQVGPGYFVASPVQIGVSSWQQLDSGTQHVLAYRSDGLLFGWGDNRTGELGDGTTSSKSSPVQLGSFTSVSAGEVHSLGITSDGSLYAWGGVAASTDTIPVRSRLVPYDYSWTSIASNDFASFGITSKGELYAWGTNSSGMLGIDSSISPNITLAPIKLGTSSWTAVHASTSHVLAIRSDGALFAWGQNAAGQLGTSDTFNRSSPVQIGTSSWTKVNSNNQDTPTSIAIRIDGALFMWGNNQYGQLGLSNTINSSSPVQVGTNSWVMVSGNLGIAVTGPNSLWAWGRNNNGQLGLNNTINRSSPVQVNAGGWSYVSGDGNTSHAIYSFGTTLGQLWAWGLNANGQLGDNTVANKSSPVVIGTVADSWTFVDTRSNIGAKRLGGLFTWGLNSSGQLAVGDTLNRSSPTQIGADSWTIATGSTTRKLALENTGFIYVWGDNSGGQLGTGDNNSTTTPKVINIAVTSPTLVSSSSWTQVSAGYAHNLGIKSDSTLHGWGNYTANSFDTYSWTISSGNQFSLMLRNDGMLFAVGLNSGGQLGQLNTINRSSPVQIGTSSWTAVKASNYSAFAIRSDGALFAWGNNFAGQLAIGTTGTASNRSSPVQIGTSSWTSLHTGFATGDNAKNGVYAIRRDGALFGWGDTGSVLGLTNTAQAGSNINSPAQIGTSSWIMAAYGQQTSMAIRSDGLLFAWGANYSAAGIATSSPTQITSFLSEAQEIDYSNFLGQSPYSWLSVTGGDSQGMGVRSDGLLFTWGLETQYGILGLGSTNSVSGTRYAPVQLGNSSWTMASLGDSHAVALRSDGALFTWGFNNFGQLGFGDTINRSSPTQLGTSSWSFIDAGYSITSAIRTDGSLFAWGSGTSGQLGIFDAISRSSPVQIGTESWTQIVGANATFLAKRKDETLWAWGYNGVGSIGDFTGTNKSSPVQVSTLLNEPEVNVLSYISAIPTTITSWSQLSTGQWHSAAIDTSGGLWVTGRNNEGQLGLGNTTNLFKWTKVGTSSWSQISAGYTHTMGIRSDGRLFVWGGNANNESGIGYATSSPTQIGVAIISENDNTAYSALIGATEPARVSWTSVSVNRTNGYMAGISLDGSLYTLGRENNVGQLGDNSTIVPEIIKFRKIGNDSWSQVNVGNSFAIALKSDNTLWGWGVGGFGFNDTINRSSPTQIGTSSWTMISVGGGNGGGEIAAAIRTDGALFVWGGNSNFSLGINDTLNRSSPSQIGTSSWTSVYATSGATHGAIRSDGGLFMWGRGAFGEIGNGGRGDLNSPTQIGTSSWTFLTGGRGLYGSTYAIRTDGRLFGWGVNQSGQIADPATPFYSSPVAIGTSSWTAVSTGGIHVVYGYKADKTVWGWGASGSVYLTGIVSSYSYSSPVQIGTSSWSFIQPGNSPSVYAIPENDTSKLYMWGDSGVNRLMYGQFGFGSQMTSLNFNDVGVMTAYDENPVSWSQIHAGLQGSSAIRSDGALFTWGIASDGALGDGLVVGRVIPVKIQDNESWSMIHTGFKFRSGKKTSTGDKLWTWGLNNAGQLGISDTLARSSPVQIGANDWNDVELGESHVVGIDSAGMLYTWGLNNTGQLGVTDTLPRSSPTQLGTSSWVIVSAASSSTSAINSEGALYVWGQNNVGQLGDSTNINRSSPVQINALSSWVNVAVGGVYALAQTNNGLLYGRGQNTQGEFGVRYYNTGFSTAVLATDIDEKFNSLGINNSTTIAVRKDGALFTWGRDFGGSLGDMGTIVTRYYPNRIGNSSWTLVATGMKSLHMAAVRSDGALFTWGENGSGELGLGISGTTNRRSSPTQVGVQSWTFAQTANGFTVGLNSRNAMFTWGKAGANMGLGLLSTSGSYTSPSFVRTRDDKYIRMTAGGINAAIRDDNAMIVWGPNGNGQLGINNRTAMGYPLRVGSFSWTTVASTTAGDATMGIKVDKTLWTWGYNATGLLGLNTTIANRSTPVQVGQFEYNSIDVGTSYLSAVRNDGVLFNWGINSNGQIGINNTINQSSPTQIGTLVSYAKNTTIPLSPVQIGSSSWTSVSAGSSYSMAIRSDNALFAWGSTQYAGIIGSPTQLGYSVSQISAGLSNFGFISPNSENE